MAESVHNPEVYEALREAGAGEQSSRAAARATARAGDVGEVKILVKAALGSLALIGAICILGLSQLFAMSAQLTTLSNQVGQNTAAIEELRRGQEELRQGLNELRRGQDELRRGQEEMENILLRVLEDRTGQAAPVLPSAPSVAPEVSVAPGGDSESPGLAVPPVPDKTRE